MSSWDWLLLLCVISSRSIYFVLCISSLFLFIVKQSSMVWNFVGSLFPDPPSPPSPQYSQFCRALLMVLWPESWDFIWSKKVPLRILGICCHHCYHCHCCHHQCLGIAWGLGLRGKQREKKWNGSFSTPCELSESLSLLFQPEVELSQSAPRWLPPGYMMPVSSIWRTLKSVPCAPFRWFFPPDKCTHQYSSIYLKGDCL